MTSADAYNWIARQPNLRPKRRCFVRHLSRSADILFSLNSNLNLRSNSRASSSLTASAHTRYPTAFASNLSRSRRLHNPRSSTYPDREISLNLWGHLSLTGNTGYFFRFVPCCRSKSRPLINGMDTRYQKHVAAKAPTRADTRAI